jgi:hypothetical protein
MKEFFTGTDRMTRAHEVDAMISANALIRIVNGKVRYRKDPILADRWMLDSGAFSQINKWGDFIMSPEEYVRLACHFQWCGKLACIVTQDYMCEPDVIKKLQGMGKRASVRIHQRKTVERYIEILELADRYKLRVPVMPVLQGWEVEDYKQHLEMYENALSKRFDTDYDIKFGNLNRHSTKGTALDTRWVGIGSTCKRNKNPEIVAEILDTLEWSFRMHRPKIHLFGFKQTGLKNSRIKDRIYSADSFAYDYHDKMKGEVRTSDARMKSAKRFSNRIKHNNVQLQLV